MKDVTTWLSLTGGVAHGCPEPWLPGAGIITKRGIQVTVKEEELKKARRYFGYFALLTNEKMDAGAIQTEPRERRSEILKDLLTIEGVSTRQLARVTGVGVHIIWHL